MTEHDKVTIGPEGLIAVFLGKGLDPHPDYEQHPQVQWISAKNGVPTQDVIGAISEKTKVFLFTEGMAASTYQTLSGLARKTQVPYLHRRTERAILGTLREYFPKGPASSNGSEQHGKLKRFFEAHPPDLSKGSAEEARRLQSVAKEHGVITTFGSLAQAISVLKRKSGYGDRPASAQAPVTKQAAALQTLDDAIAGLQLMRDWVVESEREITTLREQLAGIRKVMGWHGE